MKHVTCEEEFTTVYKMYRYFSQKFVFSYSLGLINPPVKTKKFILRETIVSTHA